MEKMTNGITLERTKEKTQKVDDSAKKRVEDSCLTPIEKMSTEQIISNGQKWYEYNGKKVGLAYLRLYGLPREKQRKEYLEALRNRQWETDSNNLVFIIFETKENKTYEYQVMEDCTKVVIHQGIQSIEKDIMPLLEVRYLINTEEKMEVIVKRLAKERKTIATMENCTGGQLATEITNIEISDIEASEVLNESYVSYSNGAMIKFGVPAEIMKRYTVYSAETATAMAKIVKNLAKSDIGIGITGQLGKKDSNNPNNNAWYCITKSDKDYASKLFILESLSRLEKKKIVVREVVESLYSV